MLKTGCRVEALQLETRARLRNCLAFYKIIAWQLLSLSHLHREHPATPCDQVFSAAEWKSVWTITTKQPVPDTAPPLSKFMPLLARLGGHNNRRSDPPPGPQTLWNAIRKMIDYATAWNAFSKHESPCV